MAEHLRRLRAPQPLARQRAQAATAVIRLFHGVRDGHREQAADRVAPTGGDEPFEVLPSQAGPCRVVHQHPVARLGRDERLQPVQHRGCARRSAGDRRHAPAQRERQALEAPVPAREHDDAAGDALHRAERAQAVLEQRPAGNSQVGLGNRAAKRVARPAAAITNQMRSATGQYGFVEACIEAGAAGSPSGALWLASTTW